MLRIRKVCSSINFRMGTWPPVITVLQWMQSQTEKTQWVLLGSSCFLWNISASFTDKLVFTLNNGEIIHSGGKVVKCIQLCFLCHLVTHQLGLNIRCQCWGGWGRIYKWGVPSWLCCRARAELAAQGHRLASCWELGMGPFSAQSHVTEKCGHKDFEVHFLMKCLDL